MTITVGVIMDPLTAVNVKKDSTLAMLQEAQARGWAIQIMQQHDLFLRDGCSQGVMRSLKLHPDRDNWFELGEAAVQPLKHCDVLLMRKDPPFNMEYIYSTYLLELAEADGVLVINKPQSLRDANEKLFTAWFPQCTPATVVSSQAVIIREFIRDQKDVILKPLDGMGGASIFRAQLDDPNLSVIIETLTAHGQKQIMVQRYIPEIAQGDKRLLLIDGEPIPYALARIPAPGETRGNLAAGGRAKGLALSDKDRWICEQVGPTLKRKGLIFVGLDVIGDYLTEINVTSPTCIRELDKIYDLNISAKLMDVVAARLQ